MQNRQLELNLGLGEEKSVSNDSVIGLYVNAQSDDLSVLQVVETSRQGDSTTEGLQFVMDVDEAMVKYAPRTEVRSTPKAELVYNMPEVDMCIVCYREDNLISKGCRSCTLIICHYCYVLCEKCPQCRLSFLEPDYQIYIYFTVIDYRLVVYDLGDCNGVLYELPQGNCVIAQTNRKVTLENIYFFLLHLVPYTITFTDTFIRDHSFVVRSDFISVVSHTILEIYDGDDHVLPSSLNGNNGSWTNTDDIDNGEVESCGVCARAYQPRNPQRIMHGDSKFNYRRCGHSTCVSCAHNVFVTAWRQAPIGYRPAPCPICRTLNHVPSNYFPLNVGRRVNDQFVDFPRVHEGGHRFAPGVNLRQPRLVNLPIPPIGELPPNLPPLLDIGAIVNAVNDNQPPAVVEPILNPGNDLLPVEDIVIDVPVAPPLDPVDPDNPIVPPVIPPPPALIPAPVAPIIEPPIVVPPVPEEPPVPFHMVIGQFDIYTPENDSKIRVWRIMLWVGFYWLVNMGILSIMVTQLPTGGYFTRHGYFSIKGWQYEIYSVVCVLTFTITTFFLGRYLRSIYLRCYRRRFVSSYGFFQRGEQDRIGSYNYQALPLPRLGYDSTRRLPVYINVVREVYLLRSHNRLHNNLRRIINGDINRIMMQYVDTYDPVVLHHTVTATLQSIMFNDDAAHDIEGTTGIANVAW